MLPVLAQNEEDEDHSERSGEQRPFAFPFHIRTLLNLREFPITLTAELEEIEKKVKGKVRQVQSNNQCLLDWWGIIVVVLIPLLPVLYFWAKQAFDDAKNDRVAFLYSWPSWVLYAFVVLIALKGSFPGFRKLKFKQWRSGLARYREEISRVLLINAKQYEDQKVTQYIRETDPQRFRIPEHPERNGLSPLWAASRG